MSQIVSGFNGVTLDEGRFGANLRLAVELDQLEEELLQNWPGWEDAGVDVSVLRDTIRLVAETPEALENGVQWLVERDVWDNVRRKAESIRRSLAEAESRVTGVLERNRIPTD